MARSYKVEIDNYLFLKEYKMIMVFFASDKKTALKHLNTIAKTDKYYRGKTVVLAKNKTPEIRKAEALYNLKAWKIVKKQKVKEMI